jgi:cytochrome c556
VKLRQGAMRLLSFANGPVGGMLRGTVPFDAAAAKQAADRVAVIAPMLPGVFATDTSAASGVETEALPAIWTNKADFDMKAANLLAAAQALSAAAATGDQAATMAAAGPVGQACGSCHDDYRAE